MTVSNGAVTVIKVGGAVLDNLHTFWQQVKSLVTESAVVLVHGGGYAATRLAHRLGHEPRIVQGRRVTTELDLRIVEWTMRGAINVDLVGQALANGMRPVGLCGADGNLLSVTKRPPWEISGEQVDFGWVGEIELVDTALLETLTKAGYLPIVAPLGVDRYGRRYNVNADTVSSALAVALGAQTLLLVTETGGVRRQSQDPSTLIRSLDSPLLRRGQEEGWISGGMHVKGTLAMEAIKNGVREVFITGPDDIIHRTQATRILL